MKFSSEYIELNKNVRMENDIHERSNVSAARYCSYFSYLQRKGEETNIIRLVKWL